MRKKLAFIIFALFIALAFVPAITATELTEEELLEKNFKEMFGEVKEKPKMREFDKKAIDISKTYANPDINKNVPQPTQGREGSVQYVFGVTIPRILCKPLRVTDIELEPGEKITNAPFVGDSINWTILPSASGSGALMTYHIMIKPSMPDIVTNLVVHTDKRTYHFDLVSSKNMFTPHVTFTYPVDTLAVWGDFLEKVSVSTKQYAPSLPSKNIKDKENTDQNTLNYGYKITAKNKNIAWLPTQVYDDGTKTYIEFPDKLGAVEAPVFFVQIAGRKEMTNYRNIENTYVVDKLFDVGVLIAGTGKVAKKVVITKDKKTQNSSKENAFKNQQRGEKPTGK